MMTFFSGFVVATLLLGNTVGAAAKQLERRTQQDWLGSLSMCGCQQCTSAVYNSQAGDYKCIDRILFLIGDGLTEEAACEQVGNEFPTICGPACNPDTCDGRAQQNLQPIPVSATIVNLPPPTTFCGCPQCTSNIWSRQAGGYACGARIEYLQQVERIDPAAACYEVSLEHPFECGMCNPHTCQGVSNVPPVPIPAVAPTRCGCSQCTESTLNSNADGHSCSERIDFLLASQALTYPNEQDACRQISHEYPTVCGPQCDPDKCGSGPPPNALAVSVSQSQPQQSSQPHAPPTELYCYPPTAQRTIYSNVWGKYKVEVKEGDECGPSDNLFSKAGVALSNNKSDLTLSFGRQPNGQWYASEVRILLPPRETYDYGRYSFSIKSIQVVDTITGDVVGTALPPSIILGLFTWDDTEDFNLRDQESWMHEVDIELSQWDDPNIEDIQFLVQPPGSPHKYRFYSGVGRTPSTPAFNQAPNMYEFEWKPAEISWYSTAGGGQSFTYGTQDALDAGEADYTQCMPANVEVRMNLWNLFGSTAPTGMQDNHRVDVVIDNFTYVPNNLNGVPEGGVCSKDCHCGGPPLQCINNQCTRPGNRQRRRMTGSGDNIMNDSESLLLPVDATVLLGAMLLVVVLLFLRHQRISSESFSNQEVLHDDDLLTVALYDSEDLCIGLNG
ncbi:Glycosyl hydrolases family 16 [Seminavis robusta]|uniref:Glycosyl hydrolases family 16 n=1 Tax=Seminavis robusta TaxID=568900 RepID=A0A9N8EYI3_9STRA|nr:Glycosyl hydrolases family 16 [Seminavis robusta]|eukprot:Sro2887_g339430.1 Glycosyl hydrolases family 16 (671) ;mRNA; r:8041-10053